MPGIVLRPYQQQVVDTILDRGSILMAVTMGGGKTIAAIIAIRKLRQRRSVNSGCIFALKSTKYPWAEEIHKADPRAKVQVVDGPKKKRIRQLKQAHLFHYTILSYESLVYDWDEVWDYLPTDFIIADEITYIKGFTAKRAVRAKRLAKESEYRIGLSGQPVENRPEDLFSIMEVVDPKVLGPFYKFDRTFIKRDDWGRPKRYRNLPLLYERMGDAMFRRSREDIAEWLPERIEVPLPVKLDRFSMSLHDHVRQELADSIEEALAKGVTGGFDLQAHYGKSASTGNKQAMGKVMAQLTAMRMLSSHPQLLLTSAHDFENDDIKRGAAYAAKLKDEGYLDAVPLSNSKLDALLDHVEEILAEDPRHKVVVFSYFREMLRLIGEPLTKRHIVHTEIHGGVSSKERSKRINTFNNDPRCRVFLSTDAGAYGVNLNQGSHLICYDLPWSGGALAQRVARIDRTDSTFKSIFIGYMFGIDTIEERQYRMLIQKMAVAKAFVDGEYDIKSGGLELSLETLREFLQAA